MKAKRKNTKVDIEVEKFDEVKLKRLRDELQ